MRELRSVAVMLVVVVSLFAGLTGCGNGNVSGEVTNERAQVDGGPADTGNSQDNTPGDKGQTSPDQGNNPDTSDAGSADAGPQDKGTPDVPTPGDKVTPENFLQKAAAAVCGALFRCCSKESLATYFGPIANNTALKQYKAQLPPNAELTEETCKPLVEKVFGEIPFGDWLREVKEKRAGFDGAAAAACMQTLKTEACGKPLWSALIDGTCLGFSSPDGGKNQRKMFKRTGKDGDKCGAIRDGFGALYFGSCDPNVAFCCYPDKNGDASKCSSPRAGAVGTCRPVADKGEACKTLAPIKVCKTGLSCGVNSRKCEAPSTKDLSAGEKCVGESFNLLGTCKDSWCDVIGTKKCEPLKDKGKACVSGQECKTDACVKKVCGDFNICVQ